MTAPDLTRLHRRLGPWLFSRLVCLRAPYFASIAPRIDALEPGRCTVSFAHRRRVTNHLGTVHAIALCNAAELAAGLATDAGLPRSLRWIPKGMQVEYLRKATGRMCATARLAALGPESGDGREVPVEVEVTDGQQTPVFRATIAMWVSPRPTRTASAG